MKKIFMAFLVAIVAVALVACKKDTTAPEIKGVNSVELELEATFDPKEGVTASDDKDGDLTSSIVITGTVDVNKAGIYVLTYTVTDKAGNKTEKTRKVTVKGLGGLRDGDFAIGFGNPDSAWESWFNESQGVMAEYSVENGKAVIDVKEQSIEGDNNWWDVQLKQFGITIKKFESYTLKFKVSADSERKMMLNIQGGGMTERAINNMLIDVTTEEKEVSVNYTSKEDTDNAELQLSFGTFLKVAGVPADLHVVLGKVYISDVEIVRGPELENQAPILTAKDVLLKVGTEEFLIKQGVTVSDDRDVLTLDNVQVNDITEGTKFKLPAEKGVYTFEYTVKDSAGLETKLLRKITVANPFDVPGFTTVGENGIPEGWETWHEATRGGLTVTTENGIVKIDITKIGDGENLGNIWENQFKYTKLAAFAGTYKLTFEARADIARPVRVAMEGNGGVGLSNLAQSFDLTTEWTTYTLDLGEVFVDAITANRNLQFWFGNFSKVEGYTEAANILTSVYLRNVIITKIA